MSARAVVCILQSLFCLIVEGIIAAGNRSLQKRAVHYREDENF